MAMSGRAARRTGSPRKRDFRGDSLAYSRALPRLTSAFCHGIDCTGSISISGAQARWFEKVPKSVLRPDESLQFDLIFPENGDWLHLSAELTKPLADSKSDVTLTLHPFSQGAKEQRPYLAEPVHELLMVLRESPETALLATADFGFPLDRFKSAVPFPEIDPTAVPMLGAVPLRISGVRFRFETGSLSSLILDVGTKRIFVSLTMAMTRRIAPDLPSELFDQGKALAEKLVVEDTAKQ